jgi:acyl transferase domain-containing protein
MSEQSQAADRRTLLQNALQALDAMQAKLDAIERARHEPIAIVGMGCRFPGGADSPQAYWDLLQAGMDAISEFPSERIVQGETIGAFHRDDSGQQRWYGGFLKHVDMFDLQFFGISPREAITMDPQQRLVLEVSWEALEHAGIPSDQLIGSMTGVFLGISANDYSQIIRGSGHGRLDAYVATGGSLNVASGRVAFTLGLQGPCVAVDTACSSSLVAIHLAVQSLRNNDCTMALAGGVNMVLLPDGFVAFSNWGMMAPDGHCKTFDARADGFVRSEGCGMIVLKRLSDAQADGDRILAVIRGSAVNQDGRSSGLTVPNGPAQEAMLRQALADAGLKPADIQYIEAHGTGTAIGDPIEVEAIGAVMGEGRRPDQPLILASAKTNLGHLESAAGIAGLIKAVMAIQHGEIPPHLHLQERSPKIPWPNFPIDIPTESMPWPGENGRRVAGVSGFGFSGTNAHVVLESPPPVESAPTPTAPASGFLALSAKSEPALRDLAGRYADYLTRHPDADLADLCAAAARGRAHFTQRLALPATDHATLQAALAAVAQGNNPPGLVQGRAGKPKVAFPVHRTGSQYPGMAQTLYTTQPVFRQAIDRCAQTLDPILGTPLTDLLFADDPAEPGARRIDQTGSTQPALFAVEYALAELWRAWGVRPTALLGHSVGEYVAAVLAGVFSLDDGLRLIAARGRLMQALPPGGAMLAVFAPADTLTPRLGPDLALAAINGPEHTVVAGPAPAIAALADTLSADGVRVQSLAVSHAFHSPLMEPMRAPFATEAARVSYTPPRLKLVSNVSGTLAGPEVADADYWVQHVRAPVQFADGMQALAATGCDILIEIGPHPRCCWGWVRPASRKTDWSGCRACGVPAMRPNRCARA